MGLKEQWELKGGERTLEPLLRIQIDLLRLRDLFEDFLDHHAVKVSNVTVMKYSASVRANWWGPNDVAHLGVISMWKLLCTIFTSSFLLEGVSNTRWSILS